MKKTIMYDGCEKKLLFQKPILSLKEAAIFTDLSESYLYKLTSTKKIPHYKLQGKKIYFDREELIGWMTSHKIGSLDQELEKSISKFEKR